MKKVMSKLDVYDVVSVRLCDRGLGEMSKLGLKPKRVKSSRVYVQVNRDEGSDVLSMMNERWFQPSKGTTLKIKDAVVDAFVGVKGVGLFNRRGVKLVWSQYAGCSCPCSPGYILKGEGLPYQIRMGYDVYVNVGYVKGLECE